MTIKGFMSSSTPRVWTGRSGTRLGTRDGVYGWEGRIIIGDVNSCWRFDGAHNKYGRPHAKHQGKTVDVYKLVFEKNFGPVPPGFEIHHKCENNSCVNPNHLEVVLKEEHRRGHRSEAP